MVSTQHSQRQAIAKYSYSTCPMNNENLKILTYGDVRMTTKKEAEENPFEEMKPLRYTDTVYNCIGLWRQKGIDVNMMLIKELEGAKKNLDVWKQKVDIDKNTLLLETNWDNVNEERKSQGLAKISNESMRKAYIDSQLVQEKRELNTLIVEYETLLRIYDAIKE
jgi:hypothetical protein